MPLIVHFLRLSLLFLNVYDTFKTLKPPPNSPRTPGRPSVRALTQRKRSMKGCLAVWIVWCCFASYERFLDRIVGIFVPFYDELKSLVFLFLILTRSRGAEPIYLHLIRPLLKPYAPTLDAALELARIVGDLGFLLASAPLAAVSHIREEQQPQPREHLPALVAHAPDNAHIENKIKKGDIQREHADGADEHEADAASLQMPSNTARNGISSLSSLPQPPGLPRTRLNPNSHLPVQTRARARRPNAAQGITRTRGTTAVAIASERQRSSQTAQAQWKPRAPSTRPTTNDGRGPVPFPRTASSSSSEQRYEIWRPPIATSGRDNTSAPQTHSAPIPSSSSTPSINPDPPTTPPPAVPVVSGGSTEDKVDDPEEWRQYPAFPSAYPPTPLPASSSLPAVSPPVHVGDEEWRRYPPFPSAYPPTPIATHVGLPVGGIRTSVAGLEGVSEETEGAGAREEEQKVEETETMDADDTTENEGAHEDKEELQSQEGEQNKEEKHQEDPEEEDDEFDVTLRTPYPQRMVSSSSTASSSSASSSDSARSTARSTALTTAGNGSSLRTRTSSSASTGTSATDSGSWSTNGASVDVNRRGSVSVSGSGGRPASVVGQKRVWAGNVVVGVEETETASSSDDADMEVETGTDETDGTDDSDVVPDARIVPGVKRRRVGVNTRAPQDPVRAARKPPGVNAIPLRASARLAAGVGGGASARRIREKGAGTGVGVGVGKR